jgi:hypothetical protein
MIAGMEGLAEQGVLFPVVEQTARRNSALRDFMQAVDREGPLLPRGWVKYVLEVSQQRISQLVLEKRLPVVEIRGKQFVPIAALELFLTEERKNGRPVKELSLAESYRKHLKK